MKDWYLYIIKCENGNLYTGITTDVERRFSEHQSNGKKAAKYLRGKKNLRLVFNKKIGSKSLALKVENSFKKLKKSQKQFFIKDNTKFEAMIDNVTDHRGAH